MYAWLFTLVFQGLALLAICCLVKLLLDVLPLKIDALQRPLHSITFLVLKVVELITPAIVPQSLYLALAAFWLLVMRVAMFVTASAFGLLPAVSQ